MIVFRILVGVLGTLVVGMGLSLATNEWGGLGPGLMFVLLGAGLLLAAVLGPTRRTRGPA